jgi:hypothetical protein
MKIMTRILGAEDLADQSGREGKWQQINDTFSEKAYRATPDSNHSIERAPFSKRNSIFEGYVGGFYARSTV